MIFPYSRWKLPTAQSRNDDITKLNSFLSSLSEHLSDEKKHSEQLAFMAENGLRQLGEPRIDIFANRQRPEPLHLEINSWEHATNLLYQEAVRRGKVSQLCDVMQRVLQPMVVVYRLLRKMLPSILPQKKLDSLSSTIDLLDPKQSKWQNMG